MVIWHEAKRLENIAKHGYDFVGVEALFNGTVATWEDDREAYGELRLSAVGFMNGRYMHLTYTDDGEAIRAISFREAEKYEIRRYLKKIAR